MIKIMHVTTSLGTGGAQMMLYKLLSAIDKSRFNVEVISLMDKGSMRQRIEALGFPVYTIDMSAGKPSLTSIWRLRRILKNYQPDVIQGWMYHGNIVSSLARMLVFKKIIMIWNIRHSLHNIEYEKRRTAQMIRYGATLSKVPRKIIYNSQISANQHEAFGYMSDRTVVIPNGFDCTHFKPSIEARKYMRDELGFSENEIVIGLIGRFHPMKDHENFFKAAGVISKKYNNVRFVLAGTDIDEYNKKIIDFIGTNQIGNKVKLLGERKDIPMITAGLDIACSSSLYGEAFPNVIGEAMACAVPCVATDVGDSAWVIGESGLTVPPKNPTKLAQKWELLIEAGQQKRIALGNKARKRILDNFSLQKIARQYESLYEGVISNTADFELAKE